MLMLTLTLKAAMPELTGQMLPLNCAELLPDTSAFLNYFESVARGIVTKDRKFSRRLFRILSLREKLAEQGDRSREQNPVDNLIRKTLCFYREQKEPVRPISYDDAEFLKYLRSSITDLEAKVEEFCRAADAKEIRHLYALDKPKRREKGADQ